LKTSLSSRASLRFFRFPFFNRILPLLSSLFQEVGKLFFGKNPVDHHLSFCGIALELYRNRQSKTNGTIIVVEVESLLGSVIQNLHKLFQSLVEAADRKKVFATLKRSQ